jgi:hypothetical protein
MADEQAPPDAPAEDEFAGISARPRRRSPVMALTVIGLAALLCWHLRADLRYAFSSRTPDDLGDVRSLAARGVALEDNHYVTVGGQAERRWALYLDPKGSSARESFFRLLGSRSRVFVHAGDAAGRANLSERWSGRLRRFDALPYADSLRDYYAHKTSATRALALDSLRAHLSGGPTELHDRAGETIRMGADEPVTLDVAFPGELKVFLGRDRFPSPADAEHELARLGLSAQAVGEDKDEFRFVVAMPEARKNEIIDKLSSKELAFQPRLEHFSAPLGELKLTGTTLQIPNGPAVEWARVQTANVSSPIVVPADAFVLVEGEAPGRFMWVPLLMAVLVAFAVFNLWYLARARRAA